MLAAHAIISFEDGATVLLVALSEDRVSVELVEDLRKRGQSLLQTHLVDLIQARSLVAELVQLEALLSLKLRRLAPCQHLSDRVLCTGARLHLLAKG